MADLDPQEEQQTLEQLEANVQGMQWGEVSLDPDTASWEQIEQELPVEWTQLEAEREFTQEELAELLDRPIDAPEGDIDANAEQALQELDIDLQEIAAERDAELERDQPDHDIDFDR